ncbi:MAG: T9SS type A sorting domain-containing protein, partial [Bacteroidota bacterium]
EVMGLPVEASEISLMDQNGRLVRKLERTQTQFDLSDLQPGIYFLKVQQGTQILSTKIFKE